MVKGVGNSGVGVMKQERVAKKTSEGGSENGGRRWVPKEEISLEGGGTPPQSMMNHQAKPINIQNEESTTHQGENTKQKARRRGGRRRKRREEKQNKTK